MGRKTTCAGVVSTLNIFTSDLRSEDTGVVVGEVVVVLEIVVLVVVVVVVVVVLAVVVVGSSWM